MFDFESLPETTGDAGCRASQMGVYAVSDIHTDKRPDSTGCREAVARTS